MTQLVEVYRAPNSPFIGISFSDSTSIHIFQTLCHSFKDFFVFTVSPTSAHTHSFKLLGLPPLFHDSRIHHFLSRHSVQHNFIRDRTFTDVDITTPLNSVSGSIQLSPVQDISLIPHLIPLPSPHLGSALLIISGRPSLCLKCGVTGHIRRFCTSTKCTSCHRFHSSSTPCSSASSLLDCSLFNSWDIIDSTSTLLSPDSPLVTSLLPECDHTRESSSPKASPSSPILSSPVNIVANESSAVINHASLIADVNNSHPLQDNLTMPSHLFDSSSTCHFTFIDKSASNITLPHPHSNVICHEVASLSSSSTHSITDEHSSLSVSTPTSSLSSHNLSASTGIQGFLSKQVEAVLVIKEDKKMSLASKRSRHSSSSPNKQHRSSTNIYDALQDELPAMSDNTKKFEGNSHPSTISTDIVSETLSSADYHQPLLPLLEVISASTASASYTSSHKKHKKNSSLNSSPSSLLLQPPSCSPEVPVSSWGERMEEEAVTSAAISYTSTAVVSDSVLQDSVSPLPSTSSSVAPSTLPESENVIIILPSQDVLTPISHSDEENEDTEPEKDECEDDIVISVVGLPADTMLSDLQMFAGEPLPYAIFINLGSEDSFCGHLLRYRANDDTHPVLQKDGQWVGTKIISVAVWTEASDSE